MRPQKLNCTSDFILNHTFNYIAFEKYEASKTSKIFGRYGAAVNSNFSNSAEIHRMRRAQEHFFLTAVWNNVLTFKSLLAAFTLIYCYNSDSRSPSCFSLRHY